MRPTLFGAKALVFVAVVWLAFFATPYSNLFFLWLCLFLALAAVTVVTSLVNLRGVRAELADPGPIPAGAPADLRLFVAARSRAARDLKVELRVGSRKVEIPLRAEARGEQELCVTLPALPRGVHRLTRVALTSTAPFGLLRSRRRVKAPSEIVVHPRPLPIERSRRFTSLGADREAQVIGLRALREGDDPREIDPRASARRNSAVVREREARGSDGVSVVLDRRDPAGELEHGLSAVAGLCAVAARHGGPLHLSTQGLDARFAREGRDGSRPLQELLDWLARAGPAPVEAAQPPAAPGAVDAHELAAEVPPVPEPAPHRPAEPKRDRHAAATPSRALLALVLLDLGFVAITDAVGTASLVLLVLATLVTPMLIRWHATLAWRVTWNLAVIVLFGLLLRDVLESSVERLLEDGLLLAAFCQVHLVNNLLRTQKPDLLILNSAMIGIVTAFFCHDLAYSPLFAAYVLTLCWVLAPGRGVAVRAIATLLLAFAAFVGLPRDFDRPGFAMDALRTMQGKVDGDESSPERLPLAREQRAILSDAVVVRATVRAGKAPPGPLYLRMNTYVGLDLNGWQLLPRRQGSTQLDDEPWVVINTGEWSRPAAIGTCTLRIEQVRHGLARLLAPLHAARLAVLGDDAPILAAVVADGTIRFVPGPSRQDLAYEVELGGHEPRLGGKTLTTKDHRPYLAPGPLTLLDGLNELSARCSAGVSGRAPQHEVVEGIRTALSAARKYALPGEKGCAKTLAEFVARECGGHCEYFASTLAILLRMANVPCRLVTGLLAEEWDDSRSRLVVRERHAHAWVEVHDPEGGWYTVDATPSRDAEETGEGAFAVAIEHARAWWSKVTGFRQESRAELARALLSWQSLAAFAALAALVWARRRGAREPQSVRRYRRALAVARVVPRPSETPRETLARARAAGADPRRLALLEAATALHEDERYA